MSRVHVVAVVQPAAGGYPAQVLYQYTYGPYGDVLAVDAHPTLPLPVNRIGHQGLFFERLTTGSVNAPMLAVGARGLYHSRNRWLHVELGRFLTRDPAETALPILTALAFNGDTLDAFLTGFSPTGHYADGFNLYEFVGSNPIVRRDPSGLIWGFALEIVGSGFGMDLRLNDAARVSAGYAALATGLAAIMAQMQWTIGGGMSAAGFDLFVEGIDATMSGAYAVGESLLTGAEITCIAVYASSKDFAGKTVRTIIATYKRASITKTPLPPGGPGWDEILKMLWEDILEAARHGKAWAKTVKKLLTDSRFDK